MVNLEVEITDRIRKRFQPGSARTVEGRTVNRFEEHTKSEERKRWGYQPLIIDSKVKTDRNAKDSCEQNISVFYLNTSSQTSIAVKKSGDVMRSVKCERTVKETKRV